MMHTLIQDTITTELTRLKQDFDESLIERYIQKVSSALSPNVSLEQTIYNVAFWTQALLKSENTLLKYDEPKQILYPVEKRIIPIVPQSAFENRDMLFSSLLTKHSQKLASISNKVLSFIPPLWVLNYFIENLSEIEKKLHTFFEKSVHPALETGNLIILSNHASWMNLPLLAIFLKEFGGIPKERIFTLLGPAITTRELAYSGIVNFSNLIKTIPDTKNGNFHHPYEDSEYKEVVKLSTDIKSSMIRMLLKKFAHTQGNILLMAPSGTTDEYKNGHFFLAQPSKGSYDLLELLMNKKYKNKVGIIGVNDRDIMPNNTGLQKGKVHISFPTNISEDTSSTVQVDMLKQHVIDSDGKPIGRWKEA